MDFRGRKNLQRTVGQEKSDNGVEMRNMDSMYSGLQQNKKSGANTHPPPPLSPFTQSLLSWRSLTILWTCTTEI